MSHVFISYSRKDAAFAEDLRERVQAANFEVWMDSILPAGFDWRQEIDAAIRESFVILVVVSPDSKVSEYVTYEWAFGLGLGVKVIPLMVQPTPLHPRLESVQHVDFVDAASHEQSWQRLIAALHHIRNDAGKDTSRANLMPEPVRPEALGTTRMDAPGVWLMVQRGPQKGQEWNLNKDDITIGRDITNDIVIHDQQVSRLHVRFSRAPQDPPTVFTIEDLGSSNGTFVNKVPLEGQRKLQNGDVIDLGETVTLIYQIILTVEGKRITL